MVTDFKHPIEELAEPKTSANKKDRLNWFEKISVAVMGIVLWMVGMYILGVPKEIPFLRFFFGSALLIAVSAYFIIAEYKKKWKLK